MTERTNRTDTYVRQILKTLHQAYLPTHSKARVDLYRYNSASIRIRIIDPVFAGTHITERGDDVWDILQAHLPEKVFCDIGLLLMLTPEETKTSAMNLEFEYPTPTPGSIGWNGKLRPKRRPPTPRLHLARSKNRNARPSSESR